MLWHLHPVWYVLQANCAGFIESLIDFCMYDDILDTMQHCQLQIYSYYTLNSQNQVKFYV